MNKKESVCKNTIQKLDGISILFQRRQKSAFLNDILNKRRERLGFEGFACGHIGNHTAVKIHADFVAVLNRLARLGAFENRQSDIQCVAVKNARKILGNHAGNARRFNGNRRVFARP